MGNIVLLDDLTINKIAAGEVIERPASVIKEMVENSIDAGATNIIVEIRNGGISYIRVTDNGKGIPEDDMEMAFERHATSKIRSAEDLNTVRTMGFRGEALASIAAIARVEMVSKTANQLNGYKVVVEGGKILNKTEAGCSTGTTITVSNLFYNTPVRYKFLKKDYTEAGYIEDAITRIALVHPEISIKLVNSGKTVIQTSGNGDLKTVIYSIYGKDVAEGIIDTDYTYENIHIYGLIGKPEIARSNRANQIFFVNKRFIKDKTLSSAAERAYKGMLQAGKFGFLVLNIDMDSSKVDVNVHPAKLEVRFEDENTVFKAVYHAIKEALEKSQMMPEQEKVFDEDIMTMRQVPTPMFNHDETRIEQEENKNETIVEQIFKARQEKAFTKAIEENKNAKKDPVPNDKFENAKKDPVPNVPNVLEKGEEVIKKLQEMKDKLLQETKKTYEKISEETTPYSLETKKEVEAVIENQVEEPQEQVEQKTQQTEEKIEAQPTEQNTEEQPIEQVQENNQDFEKMYMKMFGTKPIEEKKEEIKQEPTLVDIAQTENLSVFDNVEQYKRPEYKFIGLAFENYIIIQIEQEMYILNQKSAQEKIIYEKLKQDYYNKSNNSQLLLLPDIINLSRKEMEIAKDNIQIFREAGFTLEEFGENTIKLSGVPEVCVDLETKEMFIEILNEINSIARTEKQEILEKIFAIVASKVAQTIKIATSKEEAYELIDQLYKFKEPFTNSQGKPIAIKMSRYDIERKFARK